MSGINTNARASTGNFSTSSNSEANVSGIASSSSSSSFNKMIEYSSSSTNYSSASSGGGTINGSIEEYDVTTNDANSNISGTIYIEGGEIYQTIIAEDGTTSEVKIGNVDDINGMEISASQINWDCIASTANDALNGNVLAESNINKEYWGNNGATLTIQVNEDGSVLILENGVAMGWTTIDAIGNNILTAYPSVSDISGEDVAGGKYVIAIDENGNQVYCTAYGNFEHVYTNDNGETFGITDAGNVIILNEDGSTSVVGHLADNIGDYIDTRMGNYYETAGGNVITGYGTFDADSVYTNDNGERYVVTDAGNAIILNDDGSTSVVGHLADNIGDYVTNSEESASSVYSTPYGDFEHVYTNDNGETFGITDAGNVIILNEDGSTSVVGHLADNIGDYIDTRMGNYYETAGGNVITGYGTFDADSVYTNDNGERYVVTDAGNAIILNDDGSTSVVGHLADNIGDYVTNSSESASSVDTDYDRTNTGFGDVTSEYMTEGSSSNGTSSVNTNYDSNNSVSGI